MNNSELNNLHLDIENTVSRAIREDLGSGDITAQLIPGEQKAQARIISREEAVFCGKLWATEVFRQIDSSIELNWQVSDGEPIAADQMLVSIKGNARSILTAERTALNFLQTLSGTASITSHYVSLVAHTNTTLLDTRKTIPGLRAAQKYAVVVGGGQNHRLGLYDAYLIKENHIRACGGIATAVATARAHNPGKTVEIEVQSLAELELAVAAGADIIMLDNFSIPATTEAVILTNGLCKLEASGNIEVNSLLEAAQTGVDYISIGALTKHCQAIDLSLLFEEVD